VPNGRVRNLWGGAVLRVFHQIPVAKCKAARPLRAVFSLVISNEIAEGVGEVRVESAEGLVTVRYITVYAEYPYGLSANAVVEPA
jgi:hypothetical protein